MSLSRPMMPMPHTSSARGLAFIKDLAVVLVASHVVFKESDYLTPGALLHVFNVYLTVLHILPIKT